MSDCGKSGEKAAWIRDVIMIYFVKSMPPWKSAEAFSSEKNKHQRISIFF